MVFIRRVILLATLMAALGMWAGFALDFTSAYVGKKFATFLVWWERSEELYEQEIQLAIQKDRLDDASTLIEMNSGYGYPHDLQWDQEIARKSTFFYKAKMAPSQVARGVAYGEMDSAISTTATIVADLVWIGDVRDLARQGYRVSSGEELDKLVAGLAAIGLITSFAGPVMGGGVSLAKAAAKKTAKQSSGFGRLLKSKVSEAVDFDLLTSKLKKMELTPAGIRKLSASIGDGVHFERVTGFFYDLGVIQLKSGSPRNAMSLIKYAKNSDSLQAVKLASIGFGDKTALMVRLGGEKVIKVFSRIFQKLLWLIMAILTTLGLIVQILFLLIWSGGKSKVDIAGQS